MYVRKNTRQATKYKGRSRQIIKGQDIKGFKNQYLAEDVNILGMSKENLIYCKNMEWLRTGTTYSLRTRRGSQLVKDIINQPYGAGNFINGSNEIPVWTNSNGDLQYLDTSNVIQTIQTGMPLADTYFYNYNAPNGAVLYGVNGTNLFKINNSYSYSVVLNTAVDDFCISHVGGIAFAIIGNRAFYSLVQLQDALDTTNLESFDTTNRSLTISPIEGEKLYACRDNGEVTFFWKDSGIWALLNANEDVANWIIPKCSIDRGTVSPKTIQYCRYNDQNGYIFLASDKTLRFFNGAVERNSGTKPTLKGGGSIILSNPFERILQDIPAGQLAKCTAAYFDRYYILNFVSPGSTQIDSSILIDLEKTDRAGNPYWCYLENWDFSYFTQLKNGQIYGFSQQGYISSLFTNNQYYDEVPDRVPYYTDDTTDGTTRDIAIRYSFYTYWSLISEREVRLYDCHVGWKAEGQWNLNFLVNSHIEGESVPSYDNGSIFTLNPTLSGGSYFDFDYFDVAFFSDSAGTIQQNAGAQGYGHYFLYGCFNNNIKEHATVYSIRPKYQIIGDGPISSNA